MKLNISSLIFILFLLFIVASPVYGQDFLEEPDATVDFEQNSSLLTPDSMKKITKAMSGRAKNLAITVIGYACYINDEEAATTLAKQRARSVGALLSSEGWKHIEFRSFSLSCSLLSIGRTAQVFVGGAVQNKRSEQQPNAPELKANKDEESAKQVALIDPEVKQELSIVKKSDQPALNKSESVEAKSPQVKKTRVKKATPEASTIKKSDAKKPSSPPKSVKPKPSRKGKSDKNLDQPDTEFEPEEDRFNIDFVDVDIRVLIRAFAKMTNRNFVIDRKVQGKATIVSPRRVNLEEAIRVLESTLEVYGYTLIESGGVTKIIPTTSAKSKGQFIKNQPGDRIETRLIPITTVKASEIVKTVKPLVSSGSFITAYVPSNTIIVTDFASNISKLLRLIKELDSKKHEEVFTIVRLRFADSAKVTSSLNKLFTTTGVTPSVPIKSDPEGKDQQLAATQIPVSDLPTAVTSKPKIIADARTNSIMIFAPKVVAKKIIKIINKLDVPAPLSGTGIHVYYLKNAAAVELSKVLNSIASKAGLTKKTTKGATKVSSISGIISITADVATNALIITASPEDYKVLQNVIQKLDIRRRQVFVETLIMEVRATKESHFGVEWRFTDDPSGEDAIVGGTKFEGDLANATSNPLNQAQGLSVGVADGTIEYNGVNFLNLGALVRAVRIDSDINVISTPNIMTSDNEEAEIVVASEVPLEGQTTITTGGNTVQSIERKNVGLTLRIKPQITESEDLKLTLYQEISAIATAQLSNAKDIITTKRSIKSTIVVKDKQNVIIGGLIREDDVTSVSKVPILGSIPILGWLFKSKGVERTKTNLMVFLTPHIIRSDADINFITLNNSESILVNEATKQSYDELKARTEKLTKSDTNDSQYDSIEKSKELELPEKKRKTYDAEDTEDTDV
ncbi:MAG: type II secretion system secretin GspD [Nitrospinota bacterium]